MKLKIILFILVIVANSFAWFRDFDDVYFAEVVSNGGYIYVAGQQGDSIAATFMFSDDGSLMRVDTLPVTGIGWRIGLLLDGSPVVLGDIYDDGGVFVVRYDTLLNRMWFNIYQPLLGGNETNWWSVYIQIYQDTIYTELIPESPSGVDNIVCVLKIDTSGVCTDTIMLNALYAAWFGAAMIVNSEGYSLLIPMFDRTRFYKFDFSGAAICSTWFEPSGPAGDSQTVYINFVASGDTGFYLTGWKQPGPVATKEISLAFVNSCGEPFWEKYSHFPGLGGGYGEPWIFVDETGVYMIGSYYEYSWYHGANYHGIYFIHTDLNGDSIYSAAIQPDSFSLEVTGADRIGDDFVICGNFLDSLHWHTSYLYRVDTAGVSVPSAISEKVPLPARLKIKISPNPFNSSVRIEISGAGKVPASAQIVDLSGRVVDEIAPRESGSDEAVFIWTPEDNVKSGIYLFSVDGAPPQKLLLVW